MFKQNKKSQNSIEFLMLFIFLTLIISVVMAFIGFYLIELNNSNNLKELNDFSEKILTEIDIMSNVQGGYYRRMTIPKYLIEQYSVNLTKQYLILENIETVDNNTNRIFYNIPCDYNITYEVDNINNVSYFTFIKNNDLDYTNIIDLN